MGFFRFSGRNLGVGLGFGFLVYFIISFVYLCKVMFFVGFYVFYL